LAGETQPNPSPSSTPNTTKTIKIMPVGDSCTEGMGGGEMGSYRTELYRLLTQAGLSIDFVGFAKKRAKQFARQRS